MTREEVIEILNTIPTIGEEVDALEMAIRSLEAWDELHILMGVLTPCPVAQSLIKHIYNKHMKGEKDDRD